MADNAAQIVITARDETRAAITSVISGLDSIVSAAGRLPAIGTAIGAALSAQAVTNWVLSITDGADALNKANQKYGVAVEQLSALGYAGKLADVSIETIGLGLKNLSSDMFNAAAGAKDASAAFNALGISVTASDGTLRSSDDVLADIADRFSNMADGAGKTAIAVRLFGKSGEDMIPLLNQGSRGLSEMREEAEKLGVIVGGNLASASEKFNDNLTRTKAIVEAFGISIANKILPDLNRLTSELIAGTKAAGGFWEAIKLFGITNPFANSQEQIRVYAEQLTAIENRLSNPNLGNASRASLAADAEDLKKRIAYFKEIAQQEALASTAGKGRLDARDPAAPGLLPAPMLPDSAKAKRAADDAKKAAAAAEKAYRQNIIAQYDLAMAGAAADAEIEKLRDHYIDMVDPAAKVTRELEKFNEIAPALGLSADQVERVRAAISAVDATAMREAALAQYDLAMAGAEADAEIVRLRDHYIDMIDPVAKNVRELKKFNEIAPALGLSADQVERINDAIMEQDSLAKDLGMTFQSAFEDAAVAGGKFSDVLKGIADDILRIVLRKSVTEPLSGALSELVTGILPSFGGGRASGGPVVPGQYYVVGERGPEVLIPNASGTVVPNARGGGMLVQIIEAPGQGGRVERKQGAGGTDVMQIFIDQFKSAVAGDIARGGIISDALQGTYSLSRAAGAWR